MEEITYSDDERRAICVWLYHRKPFPTYFPVDAVLYAEIVQARADMGHERSFDAIRLMLDRQFGSNLTQERVLDELRALYERQPDNWTAPLAGIEPPRVWVRFRTPCSCAGLQFGRCSICSPGTGRSEAKCVSISTTSTSASESGTVTWVCRLMHDVTSDANHVFRGGVGDSSFQIPKLQEYLCNRRLTTRTSQMDLSHRNSGWN
jgi:hypothetical protein